MFFGDFPKVGIFMPNDLLSTMVRPRLARSVDLWYLGEAGGADRVEAGEQAWAGIGQVTPR